MLVSDWSSHVCSSDLHYPAGLRRLLGAVPEASVYLELRRRLRLHRGGGLVHFPRPDQRVIMGLIMPGIAENRPLAPAGHRPGPCPTGLAGLSLPAVFPSSP